MYCMSDFIALLFSEEQPQKCVLDEQHPDKPYSRSSRHNLMVRSGKTLECGL